jgi:serine/threonine-protein kinase
MFNDPPLPSLVVPGTVVAGKFQIVRKIGRGGMGVVVEAHHMELDERVALKFLQPKPGSEQVLLQRFYREARTAAKIKSAHVTRVLDLGTLDTGEPYMVMELLEGIDLGKYLKTRGKLPITEAVDYILQAMDAVAEGHAKGIVHRDLKPSNLFLADSPDGLRVVKVLDFGIAKQADDEVSGLTDTSLVFGSVVYMSPEQMKSTRDVDLRTDVYSLGITLYELIAGKPPFQARLVPELLVAKAQGKPLPLRELRPDAPADLERILEKSFERELSARYATIAHFARELAPFASDLSKHLLARIDRVNENTTRSFSRAKILPELKQFAKEIESELQGFDDPDPASEGSKTLDWSDDWSDELSPKKAAPISRPMELKLPKPSVSSMASITTSEGGRAILPPQAPPTPLPIMTRPGSIADLIKAGPPRPAPPVPQALRAESIGSAKIEPATFDPAKIEPAAIEPAASAAIDPAAIEQEKPPPERRSFADLSQLVSEARRSVPSLPSLRRRARRIRLGTLLAVLFLGIVGFGGFLLRRMSLSNAVEEPVASSTNAPTRAAPSPPLPSSKGTASPPAHSALPAPLEAAAPSPAAPATAEPAPAAAQGPILRHPCVPGSKAGGECTKGLVAWCNSEEKLIGCCDGGLVATGSDPPCGCPPGGPLMGKAVTDGCKLSAGAKPFSPGAIQEAIKAKQPDFQACYKPDAQRPISYVGLAIELTPEGRVFGAQVTHTTTPNPEAEACVLNAVRGLTFPAPPAGPMRFIHSLSIPAGK